MVILDAQFVMDNDDDERMTADRPCGAFRVLPNKKPTSWLLGQAKRCAAKIRAKVVGRGIFGRYLNSYNC